MSEHQGETAETQNEGTTREICAAIDFGTSNLKIAIYDSSLKEQSNGIIDKIKEMQITKNQHSNILPNIANISKEKTRIGDVSKSSNAEKTETAVWKLKRHLENEKWSIYVPPRERDMKITEILKECFEWIRDRIEEQYQQYPSEIIITAPVSFSETQKNRLKKAAESVGMRVAEVITEPFAAMFSNWNLLQTEKESNFTAFVFDFGGGTLDMSLFEVKTFVDESNHLLKTDVSMLASRGVEYGGEDITQLMLEKLVLSEHQDIVDEIIMRKFKKEYLNDTQVSEADKKEDNELYQKSFEAVKKKIMLELSRSMTDLKENVCRLGAGADGGDSMEYYEPLYDKLADAEIECSYNMLKGYLDECRVADTIRQTIDHLIDSAYRSKEVVDKIIMVGGTSEVPYFKDLLTDYFGENRTADEMPEFVKVDTRRRYTAVSLGAMIYLKARNPMLGIENRLSYEIGNIEIVNGEKIYQCLRTMETPINRWSLWKSVTPVMEDGILKVKLYQLFHDSINEMLDNQDIIENKLIYMGYYSLDKTQYEQGKHYFLDILADEHGGFLGRFYDPDHEIDPDHPKQCLQLTMEG